MGPIACLSLCPLPRSEERKLLSPRSLPRRPCKVLLATLHSLSQQLDESEWGSGRGLREPQNRLCHPHPDLFALPPPLSVLRARG